MKKVFLQTQFGKPHAWTVQYFQNIKRLARDDWYLKVFTPNPWKSEANIEIVPMDIAGFDALIEKHCSVKPGNFLKNGVPSKLVSDYYPAYGQIFQDYIQGFDYWGFTNWDMVYGKLNRWVPDSLLEQFDIWSDDPRTINGIFTLMRNNEYVNNLFRKVPDWQHCFTTHEPCAFDERRMTLAMREAEDKGEIQWGYPPGKFPYHSYDRLKQNVPTPELYFDIDGSLIESFGDPLAAPHGHFGREIMMFHFSRTKKWPLPSTA